MGNLEQAIHDQNTVKSVNFTDADKAKRDAYTNAVRAETILNKTQGANTQNKMLKQLFKVLLVLKMH